MTDQEVNELWCLEYLSISEGEYHIGKMEDLVSSPAALGWRVLCIGTREECMEARNEHEAQRGEDLF